MKPNLFLQSIILNILEDLDDESVCYVIDCTYYYFFNQATKDDLVIFHNEFVYGVELLEYGIKYERMPESANRSGAFTVIIPFNSISRITKQLFPSFEEEKVIYCTV